MAKKNIQAAELSTAANTPTEVDKNTVVKLDCPDADVKEKEFNFEHARRLFKLQHKNKLNNWQLSPDQPFEVKENGDLVTTPNSSATSERDETGGN